MKDYPWEYQLKPNNRGMLIWDFIRHYVDFEDKKVLDVNCGLAPLYGYVGWRVEEYVGFDINEELIKRLKSGYPHNTHWGVVDIEKEEIGGEDYFVDIVLALGICSNSYDYEPDEVKYLTRLLKNAGHEWVVLESVTDNKNFYKLCKTLEEEIGYENVFAATFLTDMEKNAYRDLVVIKKSNADK